MGRFIRNLRATEEQGAACETGAWLPLFAIARELLQQPVDPKHPKKRDHVPTVCGYTMDNGPMDHLCYSQQCWGPMGSPR